MSRLFSRSAIRMMAAGCVLIFVSCADEPTQPTPSEGAPPRLSEAPGPSGQALPRFPEMLENLPSVRIRASDAPPRPELGDEELIREVLLAEGRVIIGIKPPDAARTRTTGVIPSIDRATAMAGRAAVQALGAELTRSFRHSSAVAASIDPTLAPLLRNLPFVDYVEAEFPGHLAQATPPQDTSWGIKKVRAHDVWTSQYGPPTRGEYVYVTILDSGLDYLHRFSGTGDGPESVGVDCYYVVDTGTTCHDDLTGVQRGHGAHVAGIINARDNDYGYIGAAYNLHGFASIKVADSDGRVLPQWVASGLGWVISSGRPRHVVNMSLGFCRDYTIVEQYVANAAAAGALLIAAAGNHMQGTNLCPEPDPAIGPTDVTYPAAYQAVMGVSGTLEDDQFAAAPPQPRGGGSGGGNPFECEPEGCVLTSTSCGVGSRYGPQVEIAAPFWAFSMTHSGDYTARCGTSMSAALVSGAAALVWSRNPAWTAGLVRYQLRIAVVPLDPAEKFGSGRLDALAAVHPPAPPPGSYAQISGYWEVRPYDLCLWTVGTDISDPTQYEWKANGVPVGGNSPNLQYSNGGVSFELEVTVRNALGHVATDQKFVTVSPSAGPCYDF